ncbi:MAG: MotA/TolQ/ExbB proton channel family protein [Gammaproteobacteria bacterium]|nr:MotA/TolQ/ExbB proton channel family protein [Gammaproteobacteria bacterium]MDH3534499.1 MotA/TolQ/ExbB proton channel family protein [Gammaproteobacteria bacterium]
MNATIVDMINLVVLYATDYLMPVLLFGFVLAIIARLLITVTIHRQKRFVKEFCKRVHQDIMANPEPHGSFYNHVKKALTRTYFETFELRARYKRRNEDHIMTVGDRVFLIQDGIIRLIDDFLQHIRYLRKEHGQQPDFQEISNSVFGSNPIFNRVLGIFSLSRTNDVLNILPSIFIVGGIFGTFLGIMKALPELTAMDITNAEASKIVIDNFLIKISFALSTSILGIVLSIIMSFMNTLLSPTNTFVEIVDAFNSAAEILWNKSENNDTRGTDSGLSNRESEAVDAFDLAIANLHARRA